MACRIRQARGAERWALNPRVFLSGKLCLFHCTVDPRKQSHALSAAQESSEQDQDDLNNQRALQSHLWQGEQGTDCPGGFRKGQAHSMSWLGQPRLERSSWEPEGEPETMGNSGSYQATEEEGYFTRRQEAERG